MKKIAIALVACCAVLQASAAETQWLTDFAKAKAEAKKDNKAMLLNFTGSDWCPWCVKFDKEVLDTKDFKDYAAKNLVLVTVDFPRQKPQSEEQKKANNELQEKYNVNGFPTFIVLDSNGKKIGEQVGYTPGGPKPFIDKIEGFKKST